MTSENNAAVGAHNGTSSTATGANHHSGVAVAVTEHRVIPGVNAEHDQQRETQQQPPHRVARLVAPDDHPDRRARQYRDDRGRLDGDGQLTDKASQRNRCGHQCKYHGVKRRRRSWRQHGEPASPAPAITGSRPCPGRASPTTATLPADRSGTLALSAEPSARPQRAAPVLTSRSVPMPMTALFVRVYPAGGGCAQVRRSSRLAFQGRNRSSVGPVSGLPPWRPHSSR